MKRFVRLFGLMALCAAIAGCGSPAGLASGADPPAAASTTAPTDLATSVSTAPSPGNSVTGTGSGAPSETGATSEAPTTSVSSLAATSASPTPLPKPVGPCRQGQLSVSHTAPGGGLGHKGVVVVFTNRSSVTCTLQGYPKAVAVDGKDKQVSVARDVPNGYLGGCHCSPQKLLLKPKVKASALIEGDVGGGEECQRGLRLLVTAPKGTSPTSIAFDAYSCRLQAHPILAGAGGGSNL